MTDQVHLSGNSPTLDILGKQPGWSYWVIWAGMVRNLSKKQHQILVNDLRILSQEDPAYWEVMAPFRKAGGLPLLPLKAVKNGVFRKEEVF